MIRCLRASKRPGPEETAVHDNEWGLQGHLEPLPIHLFRGTHFTALCVFLYFIVVVLLFLKRIKKQRLYLSNYHNKQQSSCSTAFLHLIHPNAMLDFIMNPCALLIAKETQFPRRQYPMTSNCHFIELLHPRKYIHRRDGQYSDATFLTLPKWPKLPKF